MIDIVSHNTHKQELGKEGEELAAKYLIDKGYNVLVRNYRSGRSEIDILAQKDDWLIVVEVKTRETDTYGDPEESVGSGKMNMLMQGVESYMMENDIDCQVQYDIISIILNQYKREITHLEDAFWPGLY